LSKPLFLLMAAAFLNQAARAQAPGNASCSASTLAGAYGFIYDGTVLASDTHLLKSAWHDLTVKGTGHTMRCS
jgi:hypothetical protein